MAMHIAQYTGQHPTMEKETKNFHRQAEAISLFDASYHYPTTAQLKAITYGNILALYMLNSNPYKLVNYII